MKDKKKITALLAAITIALSKGYDALNTNGELPEVDKDTLPVLAPHIVKGLKASLVEIEENARFEGMSYEEIIEKRETEKQEAIQRNLDDAGEALKALRAVPESVESGEELDERETAKTDDVDSQVDDDSEGDDSKPETDQLGGQE